MKLNWIPALLVAATLAACSTTRSHSMKAVPNGMDARPGQYASLDRFVGSWKGTATMTDATGQYAEHMPKTSGGNLPSFEGGTTTTWTLGGHYLRNEGWHDMGNGQKSHYVEYITWDADEGKYHAFYFSDLGETGEGWMEADGMNGFTGTWSGMKNGQAWKGKNKMTFVDADTMEWTWSEETNGSKLEMRGTSTRK